MANVKSQQQKREKERTEGKGNVYKGKVTSERLVERGHTQKAAEELTNAKGFAKSQQPVSKEDIMNRRITEAANRQNALLPEDQQNPYQQNEKINKEVGQQNEKINKEVGVEEEKEEKGFLVSNISTATGVAGGVVGSVLGPAGTIVGAGLGAGLGEMLENVITGDDLMKNVLKTATIDAALTGAGLGVARAIGWKLTGTAAKAAQKEYFKVLPGLKMINGATKQGENIIKTKGLWGSKVMGAAKGIFTKKEVLGTPIKTRVAVGRGTFKTHIRVPINTVYASKTTEYLSKIVAPMKNPVFAMGMLSTVAGTTAWGEWGRSEGIESITYTYRRAISTGNYELAEKIKETFDEVTNPSIIDNIIRVIPFANVYVGTRLKNLGSSLAMEQSDLESENLKEFF